MGTQSGGDFKETLYHFSGASGRRSITYFPLATLIIGAPGILLMGILVFSSFSSSSRDLGLVVLCTRRAEGNSNLPNSSLEITIVCRHNIDTVLDDPINEAVIGICTLVIALDSLEARVFGNAQCQAVLLAQFLQLGNHAVGNDGRAFGVEAVHHGGDDFQLVLDGMGDKIGIDEHGVGGCQGGVILEEKRRRSLGSRREGKRLC